MKLKKYIQKSPRETIPSILASYEIVSQNLAVLTSVGFAPA